jgi:hypothetical protein
MSVRVSAFATNVQSRRLVAYSCTSDMATKISRSSLNYPCCVLRIYSLRFPEAAGKLLRAALGTEMTGTRADCDL